MFDVVILTIDSRKSYKALAVYIPTDNGIEGFLPNHQEDQYMLAEGYCKIELVGETLHVKVQGGVCHFVNNLLTLAILKA